MRTILIPTFFYPGGTTPARARIHVELVDAEGSAIIGFAPDYGIARRLVIDTDDTAQELDLEENANLYPDSQWKFTFIVGNLQQTYFTTLEAGAPIDLRELLYAEDSE